MKLPLLSALLALTLPAILHAAEPVYDIPRVKNAGDLWKSGFHVRTLASDAGDAVDEFFAVIPRGPALPDDPHFEVGWNEKGLLVHVMVIKSGPIVEADEDKDLATRDSVEIFFGAKKGSGRYYQVTAGTGLHNPKNAPVRKWIKDFRKPEPAQKPAPDVTATAVERGDSFYEVTVLLPWSDLGITAKEGEEASLQVCINTVDGSGNHRVTTTWHPGYRVHDDPHAMYRIRLSAKGSAPVKMAVRASLDKGRPRVDVVGALELTGQTVELKAGGKTIATGVFEPEAQHARAIFSAPPAATEVSCKAAGPAMAIDYTNLPDLVFAGVLEIRPYFKQAVFSGTKFPECTLEPGHESENALGKCVLTPVFYDADYNEVKTAEKPGRYGAIIDVQPVNGKSFKRYVTLYRAPEELVGRNLSAKFSGIELPQELGIDPAVVSPRLRNVGALFNSQLRAWDGMNRGPDAAVTLAWLSEQKADAAAPDVMRNGPFAADQKWWYGLKKKTGNLRTDYFVHLPPDYDKDPQKKWPVILFLHGSGERGYDLHLLARQPLPQGIDERKDFPFILVAPQESPGEWWSIPELDDLLDGLPAKYRIDPDRIYLTGLSMGGYGTWAYAAAEPGRFAAIVPICGGGDPQDAERLKSLPIWVFHGDKDDAVPIERSQEMVEALKKAGAEPKFTIVAGAGHIETWVKAYAMPELFEWLLQQKKGR